jgi:predicted  nucleic acid-binding Zn-ribbon protein
MNTSLDTRLNTLYVKVERVLKENSSLKNEKIILENEIIELKNQILSVKNEQLDLQNENSTLKSTIEIQRNTLNELKEQNKIIKLAKEMSPDSSDNHELKIKINELVRDIDRCIDLLNE